MQPDKVTKEMLDEGEELLAKLVLMNHAYLKSLEDNIEASDLGSVVSSAAKVTQELGASPKVTETVYKFLRHTMAMGILIGSNLPKEEGV